MRTLAIGDIHGCRKALETLLQSIELQTDDLIITLGDYVNRGPDSKGVIECLMDLAQKQQVITLKGNHEIMMLRSKLEHNPTQWLAVGGDTTLDSYGAADWSGIPDEHWRFLEDTERYYETDTHFFVHAGVTAELALVDQKNYDLFWQFFPESKPHISGKTMICGHSEVGDIPKNVGYAVCIDTKVYNGGWLTCLDAESGDYWQANEQGETRRGKVDSIISD